MIFELVMLELYFVMDINIFAFSEAILCYIAKLKFTHGWNLSENIR